MAKWGPDDSSPSEIEPTTSESLTTEFNNLASEVQTSVNSWVFLNAKKTIEKLVMFLQQTERDFPNIIPLFHEKVLSMMQDIMRICLHSELVDINLYTYFIKILEHFHKQVPQLKIIRNGEGLLIPSIYEIRRLYSDLSKSNVPLKDKKKEIMESIFQEALK